MRNLFEYLMILVIAMVTLITMAVFTVSGFKFGADIVFAMGIIVILQFLKEAVREYVEGAVKLLSLYIFFHILL